MKINEFIDHTFLKPDATLKNIEKLCEEAKKYLFKSVCVNPTFVFDAKKFLLGSNVLVCTVIGFPLGADVTSTKIEATKNALRDGADEIDMVINIGKAKDHQFDFIKNEIEAIKNVCGNHTLKVIIETCLLTDDEIVNVCLASKKAGADFVKTSTGFSKGGATISAVKLMRLTVGDQMGVKASGGIHNFNEAKAMIDAGASRIGTSSGVAIITSI